MRFLVSLLVVAALATPAFAQRKKDREKAAIAHYEQGQRHYNLGEFDKAIEEYKAAYALTNAPGLLFNIAQAYRLKKDYEQALFFYRTYLREDPQAENRGDVEALIAELERARQAEKNIETRPPSPTETRPPTTTDTTMKPPPATDPTKPPPVVTNTNNDANRPITRDENGTVVVKADKVVVQTPGRDVSPETRYPGRRKKIIGLAGMGAGVVVGGLGLYFGKLASDAGDDITTLSGQRGQWSGAWEETYSNGQTYETVGILTMSAGAALLIGGAVFYYLGHIEDNAAENAISASLVPLEGGAAVGVSCAF